MNDKRFDINSLRIASPCSVGWEDMTGDERVRNCHTCRLNIYNTAMMTHKEVEHLILNREGRLCIRLHKRADGTITTNDCPVGLRAIRRRITRFAGATLATVLGLFSISYSQEKDASKLKAPEIIREKIKEPNQKIELSGTVYDVNDAVIPGIPLKLIRGNKTVLKTTTDDSGEFRFKDVPKGVYKLETGGVIGFKKLIYKNLDIDGIETMKIVLSIEGNVTVGIYTEEEPLIDTTSTSVTTTITGRMID